MATGKKGWHVYSWFKRDPFVDFVRETPRFRELALKINNRNEHYKADLLATMNRFYNP